MPTRKICLTLTKKCDKGISLKDKNRSKANKRLISKKSAAICPEKRYTNILQRKGKFTHMTIIPALKFSIEPQPTFNFS